MYLSILWYFLSNFIIHQNYLINLFIFELHRLFCTYMVYVKSKNGRLKCTNCKTCEVKIKVSIKKLSLLLKQTPYLQKNMVLDIYAIYNSYNNIINILTDIQSVDKLYFFTNIVYRNAWQTKRLSNRFFTSAEENSQFQDIYTYGTNCLYFRVLVKDLNEMSIWRICMDLVDTLNILISKFSLLFRDISTLQFSQKILKNSHAKKKNAFPFRA